MKTANYIFSVISILLGLALVLFMLSQDMQRSIGTLIGGLLMLNGVLRLFFARDDT